MRKFVLSAAVSMIITLGQGFALLPGFPELNPCASANTEAAMGPQRAIPQAKPVEYGRRQVAATVTSRQTSSHLDPATGLLITTRITQEEGLPLQSDLRPGNIALAITLTCTSTTPLVVTIEVDYGSPTLFSMFYRLFNYRYRVCGTGCAYGYINYETDVWWTRTDVNYDINYQSNSWEFRAFDCNNRFSPQLAGGGGWYPQWSDPYNTLTYAYFSPMNGWPILWDDPLQPYEMDAIMTTKVERNGYVVSTLSNTYVYFRGPA